MKGKRRVVDHVGRAEEAHAQGYVGDEDVSFFTGVKRIGDGVKAGCVEENGVREESKKVSIVQTKAQREMA